MKEQIAAQGAGAAGAVKTKTASSGVVEILSSSDEENEAAPEGAWGDDQGDLLFFLAWGAENDQLRPISCVIP